MIRDLRKYARQTQIRLILGGILLLFLVGDGLIYLFYGKEAAILGIFCLGVGLSPLALIGLILFILEWAVRRVNT